MDALFLTFMYLFAIAEIVVSPECGDFYHEIIHCFFVHFADGF